MSETNVDSLGDRNDIYSQIFGVERRPDSFATFDSDSHGDISSQLLPNRIENIQNLNVLLSEDIANDIIIAKQRRRSGVEAAIDDSDIPNNEMKGKAQITFYRSRLILRKFQIHKVCLVLIIHL